MPTIKQKTIGGHKYELKKYRTQKEGEEYEYFVTEDGGPVDDPVYSRSAAEREWKQTINAVRRAEGEDRMDARGPSLPGMGSGGGGGPVLPGMGGSGDGGGGGPTLPGMGPPPDDGDDDGPRLPGFGAFGDDDDDDDGPRLPF